MKKRKVAAPQQAPGKAVRGPPARTSTAMPSGSKPAPEVVAVLFGQDFRRPHQGGAGPAFPGPIKAAQGGHDGLPEPTSPWKQTAHRERAGQARRRMARSTRVCAGVKSKPSAARKGLIRRLSPAHGRAREFFSRFRRAGSWMANCISIAIRPAPGGGGAISSSAGSSGKWSMCMALGAGGRGHRRPLHLHRAAPPDANLGARLGDGGLECSTARQTRERSQRCGSPSVSG